MHLGANIMPANKASNLELGDSVDDGVCVRPEESTEEAGKARQGHDQQPEEGRGGERRMERKKRRVSHYCVGISDDNCDSRERKNDTAITDED